MKELLIKLRPVSLFTELLRIVGMRGGGAAASTRRRIKTALL